MTTTAEDLGFEQPMPGITGEQVSILAPRTEQLAELRKKAEQHIDTAGNILTVVSDLPGDADKNIAEFIAYTRGNPQTANTTEASQEEVIGNEVGMLHLLEHEQRDATDATVREVANSPHETLAIALEDFASIDPSGKSVKRIIEAVDSADPKVIECIEKDHIDRSCDYLKALQLGDIENLLGSEQREMLLTAANEMSKTQISDETHVAHRNAIRILELSYGSPPLKWRSEIRDGKDIPEALQNYADKQFFARTVFSSVCVETAAARVKSLDKKHGLTHEEKARLQKPFIGASVEVLKYVMDTEQDPDRSRSDVLDKFMRGDLRDYGRQEKGVLNEKAVEAIYRYLGNIDDLGHDSIMRLNATLGIENFGSYKPGFLKEMLHILDKPQDYQDGIALILRGKDGDHNGAINRFTHAHDMKSTLAFEIGQFADIDKVNNLLDSLNIPLNNLTIAGHGGREGIYISKDALLIRDRTLLDRPYFTKLLASISPDSLGVKNLVLDSCSQGRRYDSGESMAQIISSFDSDLVVTAAPRVSRAKPTQESGEFTVTTNKYYELGRFLEKYKERPGLQRLARYILDSSRFDKVGVVRVRNGKQTVDRSGKIYIGARR